MSVSQPKPRCESLPFTICWGIGPLNSSKGAMENCFAELAYRQCIRTCRVGSIRFICQFVLPCPVISYQVEVEILQWPDGLWTQGWSHMTLQGHVRKCVYRESRVCLFFHSTGWENYQSQIFFFWMFPQSQKKTFFTTTNIIIKVWKNYDQ